MRISQIKMIEPFLNLKLNQKKKKKPQKTAHFVFLWEKTQKIKKEQKIEKKKRIEKTNLKIRSIVNFWACGRKYWAKVVCPLKSKWIKFVKFKSNLKSSWSFNAHCERSNLRIESRHFDGEIDKRCKSFLCWFAFNFHKSALRSLITFAQISMQRVCNDLNWNGFVGSVFCLLFACIIVSCQKEKKKNSSKVKQCFLKSLWVLNFEWKNEMIVY